MPPPQSPALMGRQHRKLTYMPGAGGSSGSGPGDAPADSEVSSPATSAGGGGGGCIGGATPSPPPTAAAMRLSGRWAGGDGAPLSIFLVLFALFLHLFCVVGHSHYFRFGLVDKISDAVEPGYEASARADRRSWTDGLMDALGT
jgi:hypothetical protein